MISKQEILDRATQWQLQPQVVEKDYVLGWLLAGLSKHPETSKHWVFKGGTCIKKCYLETYRFSEDLDFSLLPDAPSYDAETLKKILTEVTISTHDESGIDFPEEARVDERKNKQGGITFEGRVYYRGPLGAPTSARVKFDITRYEPIIDTPEIRPILHSYPDSLNVAGVQSYSLHELLAEKTRALYERTRPRDLYDVVYMLENHASLVTPDFLRDLFNKKCSIKSVSLGSSDELIQVVLKSDELRSEWANMLAHQLPSLPPLEDLLKRLPPLLGWLDKVAQVVFKTPLQTAVSGSSSSQHSVHMSSGLYYSNAHLPLERIRFAAANRLLLSYVYNGKQRKAEPYSLRESKDGVILLYAWDGGPTIKAFKVNEMQNVSATSEAFNPRYQIEITDIGSNDIRPVSAGRRARVNDYSFSTNRYSSPRKRSLSPRVRRSYAGGSKYVFQCSTCGKKLTKSTNDSSLRKHKYPGGYPDCSSRRGYLLEIK